MHAIKIGVYLYVAHCRLAHAYDKMKDLQLET